MKSSFILSLFVFMGSLFSVSVSAQSMNPQVGHLLSWAVPTQNSDKTPLTNLKGFRVGYEIFPSSSGCQVPKKIRYWVDVGLEPKLDLLADANFQQGMTYYLTIQAYTDQAAGNIFGVSSSDNSVAACVTIPGAPPVQLNPVEGNNGDYLFRQNQTDFAGTNSQNSKDHYAIDSDRSGVISLGIPPVQTEPDFKRVASMNEDFLGASGSTTSNAAKRLGLVELNSGKENSDGTIELKANSQIMAAVDSKLKSFLDNIKKNYFSKTEKLDSIAESESESADRHKSSPIFTFLLGLIAGTLLLNLKRIIIRLKGN